MSFGIALAGGGIRGAAHIGVLAALEENGLVPSSIAGTSAGGIIAGLYASGVTPHRMKEVVLETAKSGAALADPDIGGILSIVPSLLRRVSCRCSGLLKGDRMESYLYGLTSGRDMHSLPMRTVIPAVDLHTGLTVAFTNSLFGLRPVQNVKWSTQARISEVMRATSALPVIFKPKIIEDLCLVDGGISDVLPVDLLIAAGEPNVLAVDVSANYKVPKHIDIVNVASHSLGITGARLRECMTHGEQYLLSPVLPDTEGVLNLPQMTECMEAGYTFTKRAIPALRRIFTA